MVFVRMLVQIEVLRDSVEQAVEIVADAVQYPDISPQNLDIAKVDSGVKPNPSMQAA